ncbi:MAG: tRNA (adenosine(37)-N6)-threonylcarbamoyltransferase complex dimerization subunit type 1 TsaB [Acidobacteriota bacterium]
MKTECFLGIDTCTAWLNLAVVDRSRHVLGECHQEVKTHATRLIPNVETLLNAGPERLVPAAIGVVHGPGSFTGLRVGLAAAQGLGLAWGVPVYGVGSLYALALACGVRSGRGAALLDARRRQVYLQCFEKDGDEARALGPPVAAAPGDVSTEGLDWCAGNILDSVGGWPAGCRRFPGVPNLAVPAACQALAALGEGRPAPVLEPVYVRPPDAKLPSRQVRR